MATAGTQSRGNVDHRSRLRTCGAAGLQSTLPRLPRLLRRTLSIEDGKLLRIRPWREQGDGLRQREIESSADDPARHRRTNDFTMAQQRLLPCIERARPDAREQSAGQRAVSHADAEGGQSTSRRHSSEQHVRFFDGSRAIVQHARGDAEVRARASTRGHAVRYAGSIAYGSLRR